MYWGDPLKMLPQQKHIEAIFKVYKLFEKLTSVVRPVRAALSLSRIIEIVGEAINALLLSAYVTHRDK